MESFPLTWATLAYFGSALMAGAAILHWIYRELGILREALSRLEVVLAKDYVSLNQLRFLEEHIEKAIVRIEERLDKLLIDESE